MGAMFRAWRRFRWSELPRRRRRLIVAGIGVTSVTATFEYKFNECLEIVGNPAQITSPHSLFWLRLAFGRARSRWTGAIADLHMPVALRTPVYTLFAWRYGVDLDE